MVTLFIPYSIDQHNSKRPYSEEEEAELEEFFKLSTRSIAPTRSEIEKCQLQYIIFRL